MAFDKANSRASVRSILRPATEPWNGNGTFGEGAGDD